MGNSLPETKPLKKWVVTVELYRPFKITPLFPVVMVICGLLPLGVPA